MSTNSVARRVAQKEVHLFFASPVAWLFLIGFSALTLFIFFWVESFFARNIADVRPLFEWMPVLLIFLSGALTMHMWSDERRSGTLEHILTQPQGLGSFVWGKFRACLFLLMLALLSTLPLPLTVALIADLDWGPVIGGYVATLLLGSAYISIGLYVSARTDNPIVSLIGTVFLCGLFFLIGDGTFTEFFSDKTGAALRLLGSGSRFESISRGILDARDISYYLGIVAIFLSLNVFVLEKERWAQSGSGYGHLRWHAAITLIVANVLLMNVWIDKIDRLRIDLTTDKRFSISTPTREILGQLKEPLLIRGYFSDKTHPALSPLVPQLQDLIQEYALAGKPHVRAEFLDPAKNPILEQEANEHFGINATPFQIVDRYQQALVNSYFHILVQYGDEFETLGFSDLIEVKTASNAIAQISLRNPEFDLSRTIKRVLDNFRAGGNLFESIEEPIELIGYISDPVKLPPQLVQYQDSITAQLEDIVQQSKGKFALRFIEPEAHGGDIARQIRDEWGFKPMVAALSDEEEFFFYLTLADKHQVVQLPTDNFDPSGFRATLDAGLKRFSAGFTRTVALAVPPVDQQAARFNIGGPTFTNLERAITKDYSIILEDLKDGVVSPEADILVVAGPHQLDDLQVYAIDQYLMRGGTVILATSPYSAEISAGKITMQPWDSGLQEWLSHNGIHIDEALVLDPQNASFPAPVTREVDGRRFQDIKMINYPYFIDLRRGGLASDHPVTQGLPQLTMAWASPVTADPEAARRITTLLKSSDESQLSADLKVMPTSNAQGLIHFARSGAAQSRNLGIAVQGRFDSLYNDKSNPMSELRTSGQAPPSAAVSQPLTRSPESARIIVYASNDFMDDQILSAVVTASGTQYLGPLELLVNTIDWSIAEDNLLQIRSRGQFNRSLPPMPREGQAIIEYTNYAIAMTILALLAITHRLQLRLRKRRYTSELAL